MTHDELLAKVKKELEIAIFEDACGDGNNPAVPRALLAVVKFHKPMEANGHLCLGCWSGEGIMSYPCPTIQAIEKELN